MAPENAATGRCVVRRSHRYTHRAECSCGWRGPNQMLRDDAVCDRDDHTEHRGMVAGAWMQQQHWRAIGELTAADGRALVFDPPNIVWPAGGQRIRVEDYDLDRPILAIEEFDGSVIRHQLRAEAKVVSLRA